MVSLAKRKPNRRRWTRRHGCHGRTRRQHDIAAGDSIPPPPPRGGIVTTPRRGPEPGGATTLRSLTPAGPASCRLWGGLEG